MTSHTAHRLSVAPMMGYTDVHFRRLMRLLCPQARLYTEMLTANAMIHGDARKRLIYDPQEAPVALQLGGDDPEHMAQCSHWGVDAGFDEINLNIGCPSRRVRSGQFGVYLMNHPERVAACVAAIREAVDVPVTVKTRIGVDHQEDYSFLTDFVDTVHAAGCHTFMIHARKAWLNGISPRANRHIPPINYERAYRLKQDYPQLEVVINGAIKTTEETLTHLKHCDGVMIGRLAYKHPWEFKRMHDAIFEASPLSTRESILRAYFPHIEASLADGEKSWICVKPLLGMFHGMVHGKHIRSQIAELAREHPHSIEWLKPLIDQVRQHESEPWT